MEPIGRAMARLLLRIETGRAAREGSDAPAGRDSVVADARRRAHQAASWGDGDGDGSQSSGGNCTFNRAAAARISAWRQSGIAPFRFHVCTVVI